MVNTTLLMLNELQATLIHRDGGGAWGSPHESVSVGNGLSETGFARREAGLAEQIATILGVCWDFGFGEYYRL